MTRRALVTIIGTAFVAVVLFAVPLGALSRSQIRQEETLELERLATQAASGVSRDAFANGDPVELPRAERHTQLAVYGGRGDRRFGDGPTLLESGLRGAFGGNPVTLHGRALAVAVPVLSGERVLGVARASTSRAYIDSRVARAWLLLGFLGIAVLAVITVLALWQARRLSRPLLTLAEHSRRFGEGDFTVRNAPTGIPEVDEVGRAFNTAAERVSDAVARERAFSSDASHQLRTPLTGLRLTLERAQMPGADVDALLGDANSQVDRLDETVEQLLTLARDTHTDRALYDVRELLDVVEDRWHGTFAREGRPLRVAADRAIEPVHVSRAATEQILDALVDNALRHGRGATLVVARSLGAGLIIDVTDEGPGIGDEAAAIFERRVHASGNGGHGIGLALARRLAEAEGGRLTLTRSGPHPTFSLVLAHA